MANNTIQLRRTSTAGRTPNVTNSSNTQYINAGELALNMVDQILYSSDGSVLITVGANVVNQNVTNSTNVANTLTIGNTSTNVVINGNGITIANGSGSVNINPLTSFGGGSGANTANQYIFSNTITFSNNIIIGNSTVNIAANSTTFVIGDTTANVSINSTSFITGTGYGTPTNGFTANGTFIGVGNTVSNVYINTSSISINNAVVPILGVTIAGFNHFFLQ